MKLGEVGKVEIDVGVVVRDSTSAETELVDTQREEGAANSSDLNREHLLA